MPTVYVHVANEDAIVGEMEELPMKTDTVLMVKNPRRKDGKDVAYLEQNVTQIVIPMHRVTLLEVLPSADDDQIISFVRE
jgi:hypothetical protein